MPAECAYVVTDGGRLVQIAHRECNKLNGVKVVLDREGIELDRVIAFGDDRNDIPLVMGAGCGVAMGNAIEELQKVADCITASNDEDGVGQFLKGLLNDEKDIPTHYL
jgi:hydroxymethylpyrimidine pyrophosphatase-like HAD family hydrolase